MPPTLTRPRFTPVRHVGGTLLVGAAVGGLLVFAAMMLAAMQPPDFVSRITVANPTRFGIEIDVRGTEPGGWLALGSFGRESVRDIHEVVDSGSTWVVRFQAGGVDAGQMTVARDELERNGWRLTVPSEVGDRLVALGISPSARF